MSEVQVAIDTIFEQNKLSDLKRFLRKRARLNGFNTCLIYGFHMVQSVGILFTTISAAMGNKEMVWIGSGINVLASLINVYEKINANIMKALLEDIHKIRNGTYVDEGIIEDEKDKSHPPPPPPPPPMTK